MFAFLPRTGGLPARTAQALPIRRRSRLHRRGLLAANAPITGCPSLSSWSDPRRRFGGRLPRGPSAFRSRTSRRAGWSVQSRTPGSRFRIVRARTWVACDDQAEATGQSARPPLSPGKRMAADFHSPSRATTPRRGSPQARDGAVPERSSQPSTGQPGAGRRAGACATARHRSGLRWISLRSRRDWRVGTGSDPPQRARPAVNACPSVEGEFRLCSAGRRDWACGVAGDLGQCGTEYPRDAHL